MRCRCRSLLYVADLEFRSESAGLSERLSGCSIRLPGSCCSCLAPGVRSGARSACRASFIDGHAVDLRRLPARGVLRHTDLVLSAVRAICCRSGWSTGCIRSTRPISTCCASPISSRLRRSRSACCRRDWPGLKSPWLRPLILCGQHSLEIFCLGVFLAFAGHFILAEVGGGAAMHPGQPLRNHHHVCGGVADFVVQARCRQERPRKAAAGNADMAGGSL